MASLQSPMMPVEIAAAGQQQRFLQALHYFAPALVLGYFSITSAISSCTLHNLKASGTGSRKVLISLVCVVLLSFLVDCCILLVDTALNGARHSHTDRNVSIFPSPPWRAGSCIPFADHKPIRSMLCSHCSSG